MSVSESTPDLESDSSESEPNSEPEVEPESDSEPAFLTATTAATAPAPATAPRTPAAAGCSSSLPFTGEPNCSSPNSGPQLLPKVEPDVSLEASKDGA